ncbi:MAG TPA: ABC transporter ATP-binding protein [Ktedonobacteraceae bacterium]|nr:ABC transporter ATP-binding protein [Ktedonobacteraceae bacterium]
MFLQIQQLTKSYSNRTVVSGIDLEIEEGEIISLLGPSGCGKTTILRMIAGLVSPDKGRIQIGDKLVYDGKREMPVEERDLGMVFQDYALWPHMTVARNISFGLRLRRVPAKMIAERVQSLLELVNLSGMGDRYPFQLSGGQQQRVAVARALATQPRLVLLDEPLSSLDTALREEVGSELVQLFKRLKITTINVTHDQNEAMNMSDRIIVLREGKVQQIGTPRELYLLPANAFVASFMGQANMFSGEIIKNLSKEDTISLRLLPENDHSWVIAGKVRAEVSSQLNGHAMLFCRPDDVRIWQEEQLNGQQNIVPGTVQHASFVGGRWRTLIKYGEQQDRTVLAFATTQPSLNAKVWLELPPEQCQIVPV